MRSTASYCATPVFVSKNLVSSVSSGGKATIPLTVRFTAGLLVVLDDDPWQSHRADDRSPAHWYLPTNGDSREIVGSGDDSHLAVGPSTSGIRSPTIAYLGEIARTAELLGFEAVLTPPGTWCTGGQPY
jgi:hypothetical protein